VPQFNKCLVVIDPAHSDHLAMDRIVNVASQDREEPIGIHLFIGFESDNKNDSNTPWQTVIGDEWVRELQAPLSATGANFVSELFWTTDWQRSIMDVANRSGVDLILISDASAEHMKGSITESRLVLLRESEMPVEIVRLGAKAARDSILAAVNIQSSDPRNEELNRKVLEKGQEIAETYGAKFHVVNAYKDSGDFPDLSYVERIVDIPRENLHRDMGKPADVIVEVAEKVKADLVILGTKARKGLRATLRGNTVELVLENLSVDVLMLN